MNQLYSSGVALNMGSSALGELIDSSHLLADAAALRQQLKSNGYLFLRGLLDRQLIQTAREEILLKYAIIGEIDATRPLDDAVYSEKNALENINLRAFAQSLRDGVAYKNVVLDETLLTLHKNLLGGEVRPFNFRWPRFARPGEGCGVHCDGPYLTRGTKNINSSWVPLGNIAKVEGALMILERTSGYEERLGKYLSMDADKDQLEWLGDPKEVQERFATRWLTTDFEAGDVLCFGMSTVHAAIDNQSPSGRCRVSSDSRYQLASDALDERWNGPEPVAHGSDKVFFPGLGSWNNKDFQDEWKSVDEYGRLIIHSD